MSRPPSQDRLYRWLLRLFPLEFRGDFGADSYLPARRAARVDPIVTLKVE
ncbi:MAG TPA: hypothetical protein VHB78_14780 [Vicinamibacterales bacterium]|nr:hypothetical protein [Vicinamibacterales bacterium]